MAASKPDNTHEVLRSPVGIPEQFKSWMMNYVNMRLGEIPASRLVGDPTPTVSTTQFAAMASPSHGQRVILDLGGGVLWQLRYNATSSSAYKWEFLGGSPLTSTGAQTNGTSATPADLSTPCAVTIAYPGEYVCHFSGAMNATSVTLGDTMDLALVGTVGGTLASRGYWAVNTADHLFPMSDSGKFTLVVETLKIQYSTLAISDIAVSLTVTPVRISQS